MSVFYENSFLPDNIPSVIAGPCVWEDWDTIAPICESLVKTTDKLGINFLFKCSFDKANRTSVNGYRGKSNEDTYVGLQRIKDEFGCEITTDIHEVSQVSWVSNLVDVLQVPAFLCRQTSLLEKCAGTGLPVNVKKGQFLSPNDMKNVVDKLKHFGCTKIILTERGTTFGYNNLVVDFRAIPIMKENGYPVCIDATHSVQMPGGNGTSTGGNREYANLMMKCGIVSGADIVFAEVHSNPDKAPCDGPNMIKLENFNKFLLDMKRYYIL